MTLNQKHTLIKLEMHLVTINIDEIINIYKSYYIKQRTQQ